MGLINAEPLERILDTILASRFEQAPISGLLIAPADSGKSRLLLRHRPADVRILNDFTYASLLSLLTERDRPKYIIVPDFNSVVSHRPAVATLTAAVLLGVLAEGLTEIPGLEGKPKLKVEELRERGITVGLLTAVTPEMFMAKRGKWRATGFLRRILPIYYSYKASTVQLINDSIRKGIDTVSYKAEADKKKLHSKPIRIPPPIAQKIETLATTVIQRQMLWTHRDRSGTQVLIQATQLPFSVHKIFRTYSRAACRLRGGLVVSKQDLDALHSLARFTRYDRPEEI